MNDSFQLLQKCIRTALPHIEENVSLEPAIAFVDLGIDSLSFINLILEIEAGYSLDLKDKVLAIKEARTIKDLHQLILTLI